MRKLSKVLFFVVPMCVFASSAIISTTSCSTMMPTFQVNGDKVADWRLGNKMSTALHFQRYFDQDIQQPTISFTGDITRDDFTDPNDPNNGIVLDKSNNNWVLSFTIYQPPQDDENQPASGTIKVHWSVINNIRWNDWEIQVIAPKSSSSIHLDFSCSAADVPTIKPISNHDCDAIEALEDKDQPYLYPVQPSASNPDDMAKVSNTAFMIKSDFVYFMQYAMAVNKDRQTGGMPFSINLISSKIVVDYDCHTGIFESFDLTFSCKIIIGGVYIGYPRWHYTYTNYLLVGAYSAPITTVDSTESIDGKMITGNFLSFQPVDTTSQQYYEFTYYNLPKEVDPKAPIDKNMGTTNAFLYDTAGWYPYRREYFTPQIGYYLTQNGNSNFSLYLPSYCLSRVSKIERITVKIPTKLTVTNCLDVPDTPTTSAGPATADQFTQLIQNNDIWRDMWDIRDSKDPKAVHDMQDIQPKQLDESLNFGNTELPFSYVANGKTVQVPWYQVITQIMQCDSNHFTAFINRCFTYNQTFTVDGTTGEPSGGGGWGPNLEDSSFGPGGDDGRVWLPDIYFGSGDSNKWPFKLDGNSYILDYNKNTGLDWRV